MKKLIKNFTQILMLLIFIQGCTPIKEGSLAIVDSGRTLDSVNTPKNYIPSFDTLSKNEFDVAWVNNPNWIFANFAHIAYYESSTIKNKLEQLGFDIKFYDDNHGRQAFLAIAPTYAILSFRGTEPSKIEDLLDDAKILKPQPYKGASVHRGFSGATSSLMEKNTNIIGVLNTLPNHKIYVTGHSLGAAMAVIAGMSYKFEKIVTFGEPRVGTNITNALLGNPLHLRVINANDVVINAIPESRSYKHYGQVKILGSHEEKEFFFSNFYDHSIINYSVRLNPSN